MHSTGARGVSAANCAEKTLLAFCYGTNPKLLQYNKAEDKLQEYASIKFDYVFYGTILKDDNILFTGGAKKYDTTTSNIVRSWNIRNKTWQDLPAMKQARRSHCVVELNGKIYAIGGFDGKKSLSSVERYTTSDGWEFVNSLIVERWKASAVTFNGKIYIMGGAGGTLKSVECYNPDSNTWTSCADMTECHWLPGAAVHKGTIYVVGCFSGNGTVERYNPQQNTWSKICSLEVGCGFIACVSLDNKLWVIGSTIVSGTKISVSVYDEENDRWEQKCAFPRYFALSCYVVPVALLTSIE